MKSEASKKADIIQKAVENNILKQAGFIRKGRNFNRKTEDGLTQVVTFQLYKKYQWDPTLLSVYVGIRIPECVNRIFDSAESADVFASNYCTLDVDIGKFKGIDNYRGYRGFHYCLDKGDTKQRDEVHQRTDEFLRSVGSGCPEDFYVNNDTEYEDRVEDVIPDICDILMNKAFPLFADLDSREKILHNMERYKDLDNISSHLWKLMTVFIYGARGEVEKAKQIFDEYYNDVKKRIEEPGSRGHLEYLDGLAKKLNF